MLLETILHGIASAVVPILVLGVLIVVHEFGHFLLAKLCGVSVLKFSIGFGPAIWRKQYRETEYQLSVVPLGGYVRMLGDMPDFPVGPQGKDSAAQADGEAGAAANDDRSGWFIDQPVWARTLIVFAGPLFNFLLAIVLLFVAVLLYGEPYVVEQPVIGTVQEKSPAEKGGLLKGDLVLTIGGQPINTWEQLATTIHDGTGEVLRFEVKRGEDILTVLIQPQKKEARLATGERKRAYFVGVEPALNHRQVGVFHAAKLAGLETYERSIDTCVGIWRMLSGRISPEEIAGPLFIFKEANHQREQGLEYLLSFMVWLSVSLAVLNLLPIPVLDGGHLLFFLIEAVFGPVSVRKRELAQQFGMIVLLGLMIFAIRNDLVRASDKGKIEWEEQETAP